jgi:hypothetical protein
MNNAMLNDAVSALQAVLAPLLATVKGSIGQTGAQLYHAVGVLQANAQTTIGSGSLGAPLQNCFDLARQAGATLAGFANVRAVAAALTPAYAPGRAIAAAAVQFALIEEAQILAATTFASRDDVDAQIAVYDAAFDAAEVAAADASDTDVYRALVTLHSATVSDLSTRSIPLPNLVTYSFGRSYTALGLAQRLYTDPTRAEQLFPDAAHQAAFQNAAASGGSAPSGGTFATKFAALASVYGLSASALAALIVVMQGASLDLSAALGTLVTAGQAATTAAQLATALAAFEAALAAVVREINAGSPPTQIVAPAAITIAGINV